MASQLDNLMPPSSVSPSPSPSPYEEAFPPPRQVPETYFDGQSMVDLPPGCKLYQLVQYSCRFEGGNRAVCSPLKRLFRRCDDGPYVEVTPPVNGSTS
ncbi:hypothetical protein M427DRAFT_151814 [Gonapodya prolifera JEL478]|uniref:Uncharacterized protein n=1 Tax=Gonapodya prolifera (strain JEL478) TaxID=1344416 RepID=A0A139AUS9_GONPJ|nr:hypothetical protein M427DRAFT_151814 [Gonapodya prolifera JEL478]|eukprot:KXS20482.1 hypothetical protein M427DRAFT_151814 [Gonapodya prolifera JEL478]